MNPKRCLARVTTLGVILGLAGCITGGAQMNAGAAFKSGDYLAAFRALKSDLAAPGDARRRAVRQFNASKAGSEALAAAFSQAIHDVRSLDQVAQLTAEVTLADASAVLNQEQARELHDLMQLTVSKKVAEGAIFLHLGDVAEAYRTHSAPADAKKRLVENTLQVIEAGVPGSPGVRRAPVTALFQFLSAEGSEYRDLAGSALSRMNFSIRELKFDVHPVFPAYAEQRLDELVTGVAIVGSTRLLEVDIGAILAQRDELAVIEDDKGADAVVEIAELQYRERQIGPVQRPVRILPQDITPLFRPAHIPDGSLFVYDLVESTFDVEWAYETRIVRDGYMHAHDVVRGVETRKDHQCHNGRYVTTSGHEIPSSDWPTADVSLSCRGSGPPAAAGLQPAIMQKLGEQVLKRLVTTEP
ncbi:MAG: hypothetical protein AB7E79_04355 [Rhodospirillaceae bacterium]